MSNIIASLTNGDYTTQVLQNTDGTYSVIEISNEGVIERSGNLQSLSAVMLRVLKCWTAEFEMDELSAYKLVCETVRAS